MPSYLLANIRNEKMNDIVELLSDSDDELQMSMMPMSDQNSYFSDYQDNATVIIL